MASVKVEFQGTWYDAVVVGKVPAGIKVKFAEDKFTTIVAVEDAKKRIKGDHGGAIGGGGGDDGNGRRKRSGVVARYEPAASFSSSAPKAAVASSKPKGKRGRPRKNPAPEEEEEEEPPKKKKRGRPPKNHNSTEKEKSKPKGKRGRPRKNAAPAAAAAKQEKGGGTVAQVAQSLSAGKVHLLVGRRVKKWFPSAKEAFHGTVTEVGDFYKVEYDDGDTEDVSLDELIDIVIPVGFELEDEI